MSTREARELKQQGAIEASQNPESGVSADDAQRVIVEQAKNAGVMAFTFDPDATPEQKRAQARAVSHLHKAANFSCLFPLISQSMCQY